jgi:hypothetical protein
MDKAIDLLLGQGLLGVLLFLAGSIAVYLYRENTRLYGVIQTLQTESQKEKMDLYEHRLQEAKDLLMVVERTNMMAETLRASVESRTVALNELIKGFAALVQSTEANRERFREQANRIEKALDDLLRRG